MKNNHKLTKIARSYLILALIFIFSGYILNTVETFLFCKYQDCASFLVVVKSYFNITAVFCLYSLVIFSFYLFVGLLKEKIAQILASVLFSIFILLEIGLFIYSKQTNVLMGTDLIVRPVSEIWATIQNSSNLFIDAILIVVVAAYFVFLPRLLGKIKIFNHFLLGLTGMAIIGILSACTLFYQRDENRYTNNYIESKSFYFFSSAINYFVYGPDKIEKNIRLLNEYITLYNNTDVAHWDYPMERLSSEFPDVLSPYFKKSEKQPDIVIIIVESLGSYLVEEKGKNISFTPYLDSLASVGLYWKNCLSTSPRTYGVVPSVIGSVPHGIRGFQFGIMPKHYSLFSILKNNGFSTNFFYGGDTNFDSMSDFLTRQEPDHISNFLPQKSAFKKKKKANWWGLYDHVLFEESLTYLKTSSSQKPNVNVYLTLTTHDPLGNDNKELKEFYEAKTEKIIEKLDSKQKKYFQPVKDRIAGFIYIDDCIRDFINDYSKLPNFENTIFIITGDHSVGIHKNNLAHYSVPLIIWSPLLKTHQRFPNIVSHWGITPSIVSFLQHNYGLKPPDKLSWCGNGLDTSSIFNPSEKVLFLSYERKVSAMVYNQFFFEEKTEWSDRKLHKIDENLDLEQIYDSLLIENIRSKFNTLKYVNDYVYHNDKLIKTSSKSNDEYKRIKGYENKETIVCKTPDTIPSIHGIDEFEIMPVQNIKGKYNKIKIKLMTDIIINDFVFQDQQMQLNFDCMGKDFNSNSKEHITKYIAEDNVLCNKKYELSIEKEIDVSDVEKLSTRIYVSTNEYDEDWEQDKKITISNIRVIIYGK